ncbi:MAG: hypothetical protein MUQ30_11550, partial [Anaerolineae bacterium]|nr:hypothetical protein [Anaerolineae bacterium]
MTDQDRFQSVEEALDALKTVPEPDPGRRSEARSSMLARVDVWRERRGLTSPVPIGSVGLQKSRIAYWFEGFCDTLITLRQRRAVMLTTILS